MSVTNFSVFLDLMATIFINALESES